MKLNLQFYIPFNCDIYNACCEYYPQDGGAPLVELRHVSLWGMFDDAVTILRHDDCVGLGGIL